MTAGILMLTLYTDINNFSITLQKINHMPFNGECAYVFPQFRTGITDIMIAHNLKNVGYLINIFVGLLLTEIVVPVISDILQILTGFRRKFNGFHRLPSCLLLLF